ncbi:MAG: MBL fold metallo-hydrolase [Novosphingobium sp.]
MTWRLNWLLLALLLLFGAPYYWLLIDNRPGDIAAKPVTITQLRQLAASIPGAAPAEIEVEGVAWRRLPGTLFAAGTGLKRRLLAKMAFRLTVPGGAPIVIDTGLTQAEAEAGGMEEYNPGAQSRVYAAMRQAGLILVTHEHPDHTGGLVALAAEPGLLAKARLNSAQASTLPWPQGVRPFATLGKSPQAVAPGIVVVPAPSHSPGSQLIFVRLSNGREYLFAGDICSLEIGCRQLRARSRLVSTYLPGGEDRPEVFAWLKSIRAIQESAPRLIVIPGHDLEWIINPENKTGVYEGFQHRAS